MKIEEFAAKLNSNLPTINQIIVKYSRSDKTFDKQKAKEYRNRNEIMVLDKSALFNNEIENLIYNTNISSIGIGSINFRANIKAINDGLHCFASTNDQLLICLDTINKKIVNFTEEFSGQEIVSQSIDQFLTFLYLYAQYNTYFIFNGNGPKEVLDQQLYDLINNGFSKFWAEDLITKGFSH